jgi:dihydroxyacid dehydratase/phosphogluconate dehydratase
MERKIKPEQLRSYRWFGTSMMWGFGHRSRMKQLGYRQEDFVGKPVIAIVNTWSEFEEMQKKLQIA